MKRGYSALVIALSLLIVAAAIFMKAEQYESSSLQQAADESFGFRITWADYSGRGDTIFRIVDAFNKSSSGILVNLVGGDEDTQKITDLLASDRSIHVYALPYRLVMYFAEKGMLEPLDSAFAGEMGFFRPDILGLGSVEGRAFGIPWVSHSIALIYNQGLLDRAGVDPEKITDLESFIRALETVESRTGAYGVGLVGADHNDVSWMVNQFIYGFGARLVSTDGKDVLINDPKSKAALLFYRDTLGKHAQPSWPDDTGVEVMKHFREGRLAFEFQGLWGLTDIEKNGNPFATGMITLDRIGLFPEVGPIMLAVPAGLSDKDREAAYEFIRYMISEPAQEMVMDGEYSPEHDAFYPFRLPARKDIGESIVLSKYPQYLPFLSGFENPSVDVPIPAWQIVKEEVYAPSLHSFMAGEISADELLSKVESEAKRIIQSEGDAR